MTAVRRHRPAQGRLPAPLDRTHMTDAERITMPLYPGAYLLLGVIFLLQAPQRTSGPAFDPAKLLMPIHCWGLVFLAVAVVEIGALATQRRRLYIRALIVGVGLGAFWLTLLVVSTSSSDRVSYSSAVWVLVGTAAQFASARMLARARR